MKKSLQFLNIQFDEFSEIEYPGITSIQVKK